MNLKDIEVKENAVGLEQLLNVSTAQIESILKDGNKSIENISREFTTISKSLEVLITEINHKDTLNTLSKTNNNIEGITVNIDSILVSLQFFDRLTQRLQHVIQGINLISKEIKNTDYGKDWEDLYQQICDSYTLSEEQSIFEDMMGMAEENPRKKDLESVANTAVELF
jgi:hypothetical protein